MWFQLAWVSPLDYVNLLAGGSWVYVESWVLLEFKYMSSVLSLTGLSARVQLYCDPWLVGLTEKAWGYFSGISLYLEYILIPCTCLQFTVVHFYPVYIFFPFVSVKLKINKSLTNTCFNIEPFFHIKSIKNAIIFSFNMAVILQHIIYLC